jgi:hypothetical protein
MKGTIMAARKKKKAAAVKAKRGNKKATAAARKPKRPKKRAFVPLRTKFMEEFREQFVGTSKPAVWPVKGQSTESILKDIVDAFNILTAAAEFGKMPNRDNSGSVEDKIADIFHNTGWPTEKAPLPKRLAKRVPAARRYEISSAVDSLIEAFSCFDELCKEGDCEGDVAPAAPMAAAAPMKRGKAKPPKKDECPPDQEPCNWPVLMMASEQPGHDPN